MANVHPWTRSWLTFTPGAFVWSLVSINYIIHGFFYRFGYDFDVNVCATAPNKPIMYIAEIGWPTA
ncbi:hypothetical protein MJO28_002755 [Puccinia striiformis f. sp. tritici]|uniref:Uncharacterized protein n=1 Tax=Puccinia striiformis f. sp. tritici TaxID=168172 RepID=A0ACC0ERC0_9BASI|nr:hypothetical protein MJO28_002755 [Puccinia striiformis f. sp. tritici]